VQPPKPLPDAPGTFVRVGVSALAPPHEPWSTEVLAYFRRTAGGWKLVGIDRGLRKAE
jgi:hypothetical protein